MYRGFMDTLYYVSSVVSIHELNLNVNEIWLINSTVSWAPE